MLCPASQIVFFFLFPFETVDDKRLIQKESLLSNFVTLLKWTIAQQVNNGFNLNFYNTS